jgi:hypothetical protein
MRETTYHPHIAHVIIRSAVDTTRVAAGSTVLYATAMRVLLFENYLTLFPECREIKADT